MTDREAMLRAPLLQVLVEVEVISSTSLLPAQHKTLLLMLLFVLVFLSLLF